MLETVDRVRLVMVGLLQAIGDLFGDARYVSAAGILRGKGAGRKPIDDEKRLALVQSMLNTQVARSIHRACELVAEFDAPSGQVETVRDRLRRKFRRKLNESGDTKTVHVQNVSD